jgi:HEAT repeat protein
MSDAIDALSARRMFAAYWLGGLVERGDDEAARLLIGALRQQDDLLYDRIAAVNAVRRIPAAPPALRQALLDVIRYNWQWKVREVAIQSLEAIPQADAEMISLLSCAVSDERYEVGYAAALRLARIRPVTQDTIAAVRSAFFEGIGVPYFGMPDYIDELGDAATEFLVQGAARLAEMKGQYEAQGLEHRFDDDMLDRVTGALRARGAVAVPLLIRLLRDRDAVVRRETLFLLGNMGHRASGALPALRDMKRAATEEDELSYIDSAIKEILAAPAAGACASSGDPAPH